MAHWCLRISLHIFSVGFLLLFECLKVGYLHMMGKITKKENHFIVLLFYLLIFMLFHCLDTYCIITYCTFSHYFVKISILDIWFLFFLVFLLLTRKYIKKIGYVFKYYTKQFKKKNTVSSTLQKKIVPLLLHSTL